MDNERGFVGGCEQANRTKERKVMGKVQNISDVRFIYLRAIENVK